MIHEQAGEPILFLSSHWTNHFHKFSWFAYSSRLLWAPAKGPVVKVDHLWWKTLSLIVKCLLFFFLPISASPQFPPFQTLALVCPSTFTFSTCPSYPPHAVTPLSNTALLLCLPPPFNLYPHFLVMLLTALTISLSIPIVLLHPLSLSSFSSLDPPIYL